MLATPIYYWIPAFAGMTGDGLSYKNYLLACQRIKLDH